MSWLKRRGFRAIYYVLNEDMPLIAIILYGKNDQTDLTPDDKRGAEAIVIAMEAEFARRKASRTHGGNDND